MAVEVTGGGVGLSKPNCHQDHLRTRFGRDDMFWYVLLVCSGNSGLSASVRVTFFQQAFQQQLMCIFIELRTHPGLACQA